MHEETGQMTSDRASVAPEAVEAMPRAAYAPFDPEVDLYVYSRTNLGFGTAIPLEYSGWRNEVSAWKSNCYLHCGLNPSHAYRVKGPDALTLFSDICVNGFAKFAVGSLRHAIMCNEEGLTVAHGVLERVAEEEFITHFLAHWTDYKLRTGKYDASGEFLRDGFLFQVAGPRSLEVLEAATAECLHDIAFARHRMSAIDGKAVRILRLGMAGTLAYEVHGKLSEAPQVYDVLMHAGQPFGITKLGRMAYGMNHTESGFPQQYMHFLAPLQEDLGFMACQGEQARRRPRPLLTGSMGEDPRPRYRNPIEVGWGRTVELDHDFVGRAALEREIASPRLQMVTLEWNSEDVLDVHASQFRPGEPFEPMEWSHPSQLRGRPHSHADQVLHEGKLVGVSSGRIYSYTHRQMISLCSIDTKHGALGARVTILWGEPGARQKEIRATVARFPYLTEERNEQIDVSKIPCVVSRPHAAV
jgi:vanillate/3-O-methylgallate O-demethylase